MIGKLLKSLVVFLLTTGIVFYVLAAPYITVFQMKTAIDAQDSGELSEHVDFDSLRQNLKDQFNSLALEEGLVGVMLATAGAFFVDSILDVVVSPAGLQRLMQGQGPVPEGREEVSPAFPDAKMEYKGVSKFVVSIRNDEGESIQFILRRRGVAWKLTEVQLPIESLMASGG